MEDGGTERQGTQDGRPSNGEQSLRPPSFLPPFLPPPFLPPFLLPPLRLPLKPLLPRLNQFTNHGRNMMRLVDIPFSYFLLN